MAEGNLPVPPDPSPAPGTPQDLSAIDPAAAAARQPPGTAPGAAPPAVSPVAKKKKRRRKWPWVLLLLFLLLGLLVVFLPTIAGTGPARIIIVGQINQRLNGRVDVADWSMGWRSPFTVSGLKVFDAQGVQVLELPRLTTELKLLDAVQGRLHFGKVTVDGLNALVRRDRTGAINLTQLVPPGPEQPPSSEPSMLPDIRGELHLVNCRATFEDQVQDQTFYFPSIAGTVKCPDINQAIENALEVTCRVGDAPTAGKLSVAGRADVAEGFVVNPDKMDVDEKVTIEGVELGSFIFALGNNSGLDKLTGLTNGAVSLRYRGGEGAGVEAQVTSTNFAAGGPALKGDTFSTQKLSVTIPPTTLAMPAGASDWKTWALRIGTSGAADQIVLAIDQGTVRLGGNAPLQSLANVADNLAPGGDGEVRAAVELDLGALATQLPRLLAVEEGLTLSSGRFTHGLDVQLAHNHATVKKLEARLADVRGQRGGQPVSLQPVVVSFTGTSFGGRWATPKLRDLNLTLDSGFANAAFSGQDLAALSGKASGDLKRLRDELGQVFDLGDLQLAGPFDVTVASRGDVATGGNGQIETTVTVTDLVFGAAKDKPPIRQSRVRLEAGGEVIRRGDGSVEQLRAARLVLNTGDAARPTVAAQVSIPTVAMAPPAPPAATQVASAAGAATQPASAVASAAYEITRLAIDLPRAKAEFGEHHPKLREHAFDSGVVNLTGGGKYENGALTYDGRVAVNNLTMARVPAAVQPAPGAPAALAAAPAGRVEVIRGYTLTTDATFAYTPREGGSELRVTKLAVDDDRRMVSVKNWGEQPLRLVTTAAGGLQPSGQLNLGLDLKQLNDVRERLAAEGPVAVAGPDRTQLRSGRLSGTVDLGRAAGQGEFVLAANLQGTELTVGNARGDALANEGVTIVSLVRAKDDFSAATVDRLDVTGSLLTANVSGTTLKLDAASPLAMVESATVKAQAPDLGKVQALLDALSTPETPAVASSRRSGIPDLKPDISPVAPILFAQARQAPPPDQVIGRRPQPAPAPRQPGPAPVPRGQAAPPAAPNAGDESPAPPIKLAGGSASLSLVVKRDGQRTVVTPEVNGKNVTLRRGEGSHTLDAVDVKTTVSFVPVAPPATAPATAPTTAPAEAPSLAQQIRDLQIPELLVRGAGSTITLAEPVTISDVGALGRLFSASPDAPAGNIGTVKAALKGEGDVGQLSALLVALGMIGDPAGPKQPYSGRYDVEQRFTAGTDGVAATGKLNLNDFAAAAGGAGGGSFNEKAIRFANDVTLDAARDALALRGITLVMESTKALELKLAGNVLDYSTKRRFDKVEGTIGYDWAKLWEIVRPMLSREQQENLKLRIAGQAQRQFAIGGSYPAVDDKGQPLPFNRAIRSLTGHFDGGFQLVEINGLQVQNLELPLTLADGKLFVAYHDKPEGQNKPPPADCNSGKLDIAGAVVDLTGDAPRLNMPPNTKLLTKATLNPVLSDKFGRMINNPMFVDTREARGLVEITVVRCERLPLDSLVLKNARENDGRAEFLYSIDEVYLGNNALMKALKAAGQAEFAESMQGAIRESRLIIERGQTRQDLTLNVGERERPFRLRGSTVLETGQLDLTFTVPPQLFRQLGDIGRQAAEYLPEGVDVPVRGTPDALKVPNLMEIAVSTVKKNFVPGVLERVIGGNRGAERGADRGADRGTDRGTGRTPARDGSPMPPSDPPPRQPPREAEPPAGNDPVGDLFDLIGRQREQKEKEKQEERDRRRRERERQQQGSTDPAEAEPAAGRGSGASGSDRIGRQPARGRDRNR